MAALVVSESLSSLESLPLLALELVCEYLAYGDSERRALLAFSLASKRCCAVATRERFERVLFAVRGPQQLKRDLARYDAVLGKGARSRYVRRVKITGGVSMSMEEEDRVEAPETEAVEDADARDGDSDVEYGEDVFTKPPKSLSGFGGSGPQYTQDQKAKQNEAWQPLAQFISRLIGLKDFIWVSYNQVPLCILSALHSLPQSRLHVHTLDFRSLYQPKDQPRDIDPDEYALATSPSLSDVAAVNMYYDYEGRVVYNQEAVLQMVSRVGSKISSVCMCYLDPGDGLALREAFRSPRPPWRGFHVGEPPSVAPESKGHLTNLALIGAGSTSSEDLHTWSRHTHLSELRRLEIRNFLDPKAIRTLTEMAEQGAFKSLRTLALFVADYYCEESVIDEAMGKLLYAITPLEGLDATGSAMEKSLNAVLNHHGSALRRLYFPSLPISCEGVQALRKACPNLYDMELHIIRSGGDHQEVSAYRALGSFPRLQRLRLFLDCSGANSLEGFENASQDDRLVQRMRAAIKHRAMDARLARSIFHIIFSANREARHGLPASFQCLRLGGYGGIFADEDGHFAHILDWIGRSWICKRDLGDANCEHLTVTETEKSYRGSRDRVDEDLGKYPSGSLYKRAWYDAYPGQVGDWRDEWSSFPLSEEP